MDTSVLTSSQWGMIFILLSMDVMTPLWKEMGLQLSDVDKFRQLLRRLILENRKSYEQNPEVIPPLADRVLEETEAALGQSDAERLYQWATNVFTQVHADLPQWSAWEILFFRAAYNPKLRDRLALPEDKRDTILDKYKEAMATDDVEAKILVIKAKPLSDWDLEMYSIHQFNNDDDLTDPFSVVLRTIQMNRFQLFWMKLLPQLSEDELTNMQRESQKLLKETGIWLPDNEELEHPDKLRRQV